MKKWFKPWPETWFKLKQREKELNGQGELFQLQKLNIQNSSKIFKEKFCSVNSENLIVYELEHIGIRIYFLSFKENQCDRSCEHTNQLVGLNPMQRETR